MRLATFSVENMFDRAKALNGANREEKDLHWKLKYVYESGSGPVIEFSKIPYLA